MLIGAVGSLPVVLLVARGGGVPAPDAAFTTFVSANYAPDADESPTTLTFTVKDANDDPIAGQAVTYA